MVENLNKEMQKTILGSLKEVSQRGWQLSLEVDGNFIPVYFGNIDRIRLSSVYSTLTYGKSPNGFNDRWAFHEMAGGCSVIIPWVMIDDQLFIGMVERDCPFVSEIPVLTLPMDHFYNDTMETGLFEFEKETGEKVSMEIYFWKMAGEGNPNFTYFETVDKGEGFDFFSACFSAEKLEETEKDSGIYQIIGDAKPLGKKEAFAKGLRFYPYKKAGTVSDFFTRAALGTLLSEVFNITLTIKEE